MKLRRHIHNTVRPLRRTLEGNAKVDRVSPVWGSPVYLFGRGPVQVRVRFDHMMRPAESVCADTRGEDR